MRAFVAIAILALGVAGITAAAAADLPSKRGGSEYSSYSAYGHRAGSIVIVDNQPGVLVRAYWRQPWRNRHYYPTSGEAPDTGRDEAGGAPEPAENFERYWSTSSTFLREPPRRDLPPPPLK